MKEAAAERRTAARRAGKADAAAKDEKDVLDRIQAMPSGDRTIAKRLHAIVRSEAPHLTPRLWYGMPAYALDGKVVCFFQDAAKFKARYATLGFSDRSALDDGAMWPTSYAVTALGDEEEAEVRALLRRALG